MKLVSSGHAQLAPSVDEIFGDKGEQPPKDWIGGDLALQTIGTEAADFYESF